MFQMERLTGLGEVIGLLGIRGRRKSFFDIAKAAFSGADIAENEKGGCTVAIAFGAIGAVGLLADSMQMKLFNQSVDFVIFRISLLRIFQP